MARYITPAGLNYVDYINRQIRNFSSREQIEVAIDNWLAKPDGPSIFLLTGVPGSGKTAIAGRLFQYALGTASPLPSTQYLKPDFLSAVFFCSARDQRWVNPLVFVETLALQLAARYPIFATELIARGKDQKTRIEVNIHIEHMDGGEVTALQLEHLDLGTLSPEDAFAVAVREPLEVLCAHHESPIVILIDALDEAVGGKNKQGIMHLVTQTSFLPASVRFIITSRSDIEVLEHIHDRQFVEYSLSTGPGLTQSLVDIRSYIVHILSEHQHLQEKFEAGLTTHIFADAFQAKSKGNFLYARYMVEMLNKESGMIGLKSLTDAPDDLDGMYRQFLKRLKVRSDTWSQKYALILGMLAVAQEPMELNQISAFTGVTRRSVKAVLDRVRPFLTVDETPRASQQKYALYHRSFAHFLINLDLAGKYWCDDHECDDRIVSYYFTTYSNCWDTCDSYGLSYLVVHLDAVLKNYLQFETVVQLKQLSDLLLMSDPRTADSLTQCALRIATLLPHKPEALSLALWARGNWETYHEPEAAVVSYERALQGYREANQLLAVGRLYSNLVASLTYAERFQDAQIAYEHARHILQELGDSAAYYLLTLEENYGLLLISQHQYEAALERLRRALDLALEQKQNIVGTEICVNMAMALMYLDRFPESERILEQARIEALQQQQSLTVARIDRNVGQLHMRAGQKEAAMAKLNEARTQFEALDNALEMREIDELLHQLGEQ